MLVHPGGPARRRLRVERGPPDRGQVVSEVAERAGRGSAPDPLLVLGQLVVVDQHGGQQISDRESMTQRTAGRDHERVRLRRQRPGLLQGCRIVPPLDQCDDRVHRVREPVVQSARVHRDGRAPAGQRVDRLHHRATHGRRLLVRRQLLPDVAQLDVRVEGLRQGVQPALDRAGQGGELTAQSMGLRAGAGQLGVQPLDLVPQDPIPPALARPEPLPVIGHGRSLPGFMLPGFMGDI